MTPEERADDVGNLSYPNVAWHIKHAVAEDRERIIQKLLGFKRMADIDGGRPIYEAGHFSTWKGALEYAVEEIRKSE